MSVRGFDNLTPDIIIDAVESALRIPLTGLTHPLPSYINRVYELQDGDGSRWIAKFYRPGRWTREALLDEHRFVLDCRDEDIPVVAPVELDSGHTIGEVDGVFFAVYPKRLGREIELENDDDWRSAGSVVARMHLAGAMRGADARIVLRPDISTAADLAFLRDGGFVAERHLREFAHLADRVMDVLDGLFNGVEIIRIHGDCHRGNILFRPDDGLTFIDFDDMMMGPPIQDLWLILPDHAEASRREIELLLDGYELFREFDYSTLRLVEPLRLMRLIYFLAWCARQSGDFRFRNNFPDWGTDAFWRREIADLERQLRTTVNHLEALAPSLSLTVGDDDDFEFWDM